MLLKLMPAKLANLSQASTITQWSISERSAIFIFSSVKIIFLTCCVYNNQMMFYESIFLRQFSMKLLGLLTTKHFFSFILGCPQDFNFARPFCPFSPVSTQPYQNGQAKLNSCGHPRIKLKKCVVVGRPKSFIENCRRKIDS